MQTEATQDAPTVTTRPKCEKCQDTGILSVAEGYYCKCPVGEDKHWDDYQAQRDLHDRMSDF